MNMLQVKYFVAVAKSLSFTKAAEQLYISQPSLSRYITKMESELNLQLFLRTGRTVRLTPAGNILYLGLSELYENYYALVEKAQNAQKGLNGILNIGILDEVNVADFMPPIYQYFKEIHPNIELAFHTSTFSKLITDVYNGKLDLIFTVKFEVENRDHLLYQKLEDSKDYIVINRSHPLAEKKNLSLIDLKDEMFVMISPEDNSNSSPLIFQACQKAGFKPKHCFASSLAEQILWVEVGKGVTILDDRTSLKMNPYIKFVEMESDWDPSLVAAWNQENYNPAIPTFLKKLEETLEMLKNQ
ncbi:LysR family transcriptional regulator [Parasporobacterium paucivorans]|uniref:DNA-binding transcriptional regulator, LysR family n=1 Tax=Parasporobacterium paucivorans DSM 15970 TaxID=1122934 RepID=A0A1M6FDN0_9FIRM|nr:LysR family transcriptional regulator [Parasporobacterium paucivorans]SHI95755.1 DNA-binding transcriptional regulator, LysR family [Parasporobacterium paucivorans DSM 15970]